MNVAPLIIGNGLAGESGHIGAVVMRCGSR